HLRDRGLLRHERCRGPALRSRPRTVCPSGLHQRHPDSRVRRRLAERLVRESREATMRADPNRDVIPEVAAYYPSSAEEARLTEGASRLEFARTKEILARVLPAAPARVIDVGGAA